MIVTCFRLMAISLILRLLQFQFNFASSLVLSPIKLLKHASSGGPLQSLLSAKWVKFICGASNQDLPHIRNLCYVYTLSGVDCIDLSPDLAVLEAAHNGINAAIEYLHCHKPVVMISVNDGNDVHFRKAYFDKTRCPPDCWRPCERVCPASAIPSIQLMPSLGNAGVVTEKCYGCGRCISACPLGLIEAQNHDITPTTINNILSLGLANAIEIHVGPGRQEMFAAKWAGIAESIMKHAQVLSISFPNMKADTIPFVESLQVIIELSAHWNQYKGIQIWQADGRPMTGDMGKGTVYPSIDLAQLILNSRTSSLNFHNNRQFVQLAGGTNNYSAEAAAECKLQSIKGFGGFAFGGYARKALLKSWDAHNLPPNWKIEDYRDVLVNSLDFAQNLVNSVKLL